MEQHGKPLSQQPQAGPFSPQTLAMHSATATPEVSQTPSRVSIEEAFDSMLGSRPNGQISLLVGPAKSKKSTLLLQYLCSKARKGDDVLYCSSACVLDAHHATLPAYLVNSCLHFGTAVLTQLKTKFFRSTDDLLFFLENFFTEVTSIASTNGNADPNITAPPATPKWIVLDHFDQLILQCDVRVVLLIFGLLKNVAHSCHPSQRANILLGGMGEGDEFYANPLHTHHRVMSCYLATTMQIVLCGSKWELTRGKTREEEGANTVTPSFSFQKEEQHANDDGNGALELEGYLPLRDNAATVEVLHFSGEPQDDLISPLP